MGASFSVELRKLYKRPATWILAGLLVLIVALFSYVLGYAITALLQGGDGGAPSFSGMYPENVASAVLPVFSGIGTSVALILGVLCMGSEYGWDTFKFVLTQRPSRLSFFVGKALALGTVLAVFCALALVVGLALSYLVVIIRGAPAQWPPLWELVKAFGAGWLALAAFAALGILLATLFRGSTLAMSLGLVYLLALESVVAGILSQNSATETVGLALPGKNAGDLLNSFGQSTQSAQGAAASQQSGLETVDPAQSVLVIVVYTLVFLGIAALIFRKRDLA